MNVCTCGGRLCGELSHPLCPPSLSTKERLSHHCFQGESEWAHRMRQYSSSPHRKHCSWQDTVLSLMLHGLRCLTIDSLFAFSVIRHHVIKGHIYTFYLYSEEQ